MSGCFGRNPHGQRERMSHRDAQDPHRAVRRYVRHRVLGRQIYALPPGQLRQEDGAEPQHSPGADEQHDELDRRQLCVLHQGE